MLRPRTPGGCGATHPKGATRHSPPDTPGGAQVPVIPAVATLLVVHLLTRVARVRANALVEEVQERSVRVKRRDGREGVALVKVIKHSVRRATLAGTLTLVLSSCNWGAADDGVRLLDDGTRAGQQLRDGAKDFGTGAGSLAPPAGVYLGCEAADLRPCRSR